MLELSDEQRRQLEEYERSRDGDPTWNAHYTVERMIEIWRGIPAKIDDAADWTPDDYWGAALLWRDRLEEVLAALSPPLRTRLASEIAPIDSEFHATTDEDIDELRRGWYRVDESKGWWWWRIPKRGSIRQRMEHSRKRRDQR